MSQNNSHMHTEPARTVFHQSHLGSWFTIGFHRKRGKMFLLLRTISSISDWSVVNCSLARENRSPRKKINKRVKYRESLREPLNLTGPKKSGRSGRYFLLLDLLKLSSFFPTGGSGLVCIITCGIMPTDYYSFYFWRRIVWRKKLHSLKYGWWYHLVCNMFSMEI